MKFHRLFSSHLSYVALVPRLFAYFNLLLAQRGKLSLIVAVILLLSTRGVCVPSQTRIMNNIRNEAKLELKVRETTTFSSSPICITITFYDVTLDTLGHDTIQPFSPSLFQCLVELCVFRINFRLFSSFQLKIPSYTVRDYAVNPYSLCASERVCCLAS